MNRIKVLEVYLEGKKVGTLAKTAEGLAAFEYAKDWLFNGFSISPFSLPLKEGVFVPKGFDPFGGVFGVFADSLPDGWGKLLVDRLLLKNNISPEEVDSLTRLSIVASTGMGALSYQPESMFRIEKGVLSLDELAQECKQMFETTHSLSGDGE